MYVSSEPRHIILTLSPTAKQAAASRAIPAGGAQVSAPASPFDRHRRARERRDCAVSLVRLLRPLSRARCRREDAAEAVDRHLGAELEAGQLRLLLGGDAARKPAAVALDDDDAGSGARRADRKRSACRRGFSSDFFSSAFFSAAFSRAFVRRCRRAARACAARRGGPAGGRRPCAPCRRPRMQPPCRPAGPGSCR